VGKNYSPFAYALERAEDVEKERIITVLGRRDAIVEFFPS
jgi:hypothetical protein